MTSFAPSDLPPFSLASSRRAPSSLSQRMDSNVFFDKLSNGHSAGISNPFCVSASASKADNSDIHLSLQSSPCESSGRRGGGNVGERGNRGSSSFSRLLLPRLCGSQKGRRLAADNKSEETEQNLHFSSSSFSHGHGQGRCLSSPSRGLGSLHRSKRCLFSRVRSSSPSSLSPIRLEREALSISCPPFRPRLGPIHFHNVDQANRRLSSISPNPSGLLFRRHSGDREVGRGMSRPSEFYSPSSPISRVSHKSEEIKSGTFSEFPFSRSSVGHSVGEDLPPGGETGRDSSTPLLSNSPTGHALHVLLGHMTSSILAVSLIRLHARPLQRDLATVYRTEKDSKKRVLLSDFSKESLRWILSLDIHRCMAPMWPLQMESCDLEVSTDASDLGWGIHFDGRLHQGRWDADAPAHINAKELFTLHIFLRDFLPSSILPRSLLWRTDNTTAMAYVKKEGGTISQSLLQIATQLLLLAEEKQIRILPVYVPSEENLLADAASRFQSLPDWHLNPSVFNMICHRWGSPVIDLFATDLSSQLPRFFAWGQSQRAEAFDALLQPWAFTLAYAFPPPALLPRTLNKIAVSQGEFLLVVPFWPTQKWFPVLLEMNILEVRRLPLLPDIVTDLTTQSPPRNLSLLHLLVLKISGGSTHRQSLTTRSGSLPEVGEDLQPHGMTQSGERSRIFSLPDEFRSIKLI